MLRIVLFLALSFMMDVPALGQPPVVLHVDHSATGPTHDGSTWCNAFLNLQDALAAAIPDATIKVADGIYKPDQRTGQPTGARSATFQLLNGVTLLGGYAGCGAIDANVRDVTLHETILSGDLAGDDGPGFSNNDENSYHVVTGSFTDQSAVLDGFTITGGNANGPDPDLRGGGLFINAGSPTIGRCTFRRNRAILGGAMNNEGASPIVTDCIFEGNSAGFAGGAIRGWDSFPFVQNSLFVGNTADSGGAAWHGDSIPRFVNCTFFANSAAQGNALAFDSCCPPQPSTLFAMSCIFWDGGDELWNEDESVINVTYSDIQGGLDGVGNIDADPRFVPGPGGCFYLSQTNAGQNVNSNCLDAGHTGANGIGLNEMTTRSDEVGDLGAVDMGYHFRLTGRALVLGDFDRNLRIDLRDFARLQSCFSGEGATDVSPCCRIFDYELDADVDLEDFESFRLARTGP